MLKPLQRQGLHFGILVRPSHGNFGAAYNRVIRLNLSPFA